MQFSLFLKFSALKGTMTMINVIEIKLHFRNYFMTRYYLVLYPILYPTCNSHCRTNISNPKILPTNTH